MERGMMRLVGFAVLVVSLYFLSGCGGPDTEDQTLTEARRTLEEAGVPEENITVVGDDGGDPDEVVVCDQRPSAATPEEPVRLEVATVCPSSDEDDGRKKKRRFGGRRGR